MARKAFPWWWEEKQGWYVNHQGQRYRLGDHPEGCPKPKKSSRTKRWNYPQQIEQAFDRLKNAPRAGSEGSRQPEELIYVSQLLQKFLNWSRENRAPKTHQRYFDFLDSFERHWHGLMVSDVSEDHVTQWLDKHHWNSTTKFNALTALKRAFNWCVSNTKLKANPIASMTKPTPQRRTETVTPEEFEKLCEHCLPDFRDIITVSYDSGARPFELKDMEARHLQLDKQRAVIPASEAKGRRRTRVIYFPTERSMEIIQRLCGKYPTGVIFRNSKGNAWTGSAIKCAFARLDHVLGRRVTHYSLRHSYVTRKIVAGVDSHVVATLSGHTSTEMIDRVYSAVAKDHEFLLEQARKDISPEKDA